MQSKVKTIVNGASMTGTSVITSSTGVLTVKSCVKEAQ
jgi:hypothetical protein